MPVMTSMRALEQLVLGLRVLTVGMAAPELLEDLRCGAHERTRRRIHERQLDLDAQAGALGRVELDLHPARLATARAMLRRVTHGYSTRPSWFVDPEGRPTLLRGVNLGGSTKVPFTPDGGDAPRRRLRGLARRLVRRPAGAARRARPPSRPDRALGLRRAAVPGDLGGDRARGPGEHDEQYLDYVRECVRRAGSAACWCSSTRTRTCGVAGPVATARRTGRSSSRGCDRSGSSRRARSTLDALDWPSNYMTAPVATMWTLFYGGERVRTAAAPRRSKRSCRTRYLASIAAVAERIADLDNVLGYDTLNEPNGGYIGMRPEGLQPRAAGSWVATSTGPEPNTPLAVARDRGEDGGVWSDGCPWLEVGLWDRDADGAPVLAMPDGLGGDDLARPHGPVRRALPRRSCVTSHPTASCSSRGRRMELDTEWRRPRPARLQRPPLVRRHDAWSPGRSTRTRTGRSAARSSRGAEAISGRAREDARWHAADLPRPDGRPADADRRVRHPVRDERRRGVPHRRLVEAGGGARRELPRHGPAAAPLDPVELHRRQLARARRPVEPTRTCRSSAPTTSSDPDDLDSGGRATRAFCRPYVRHWAGAPQLDGVRPRVRRCSLRVDSVESRRSTRRPSCTCPGSTTRSSRR